MQETVVYLKKITQPEGEKKELERELSQCGWELFRMGMQEQYGLYGEKITICLLYTSPSPRDRG